MGGTGRSKRRQREIEHGTGLEHLGITRLSEGGGQRDRARRRRLAYKLEKQGKDLNENAELKALVGRQKRHHKLRMREERKKRKLDESTPKKQNLFRKVVLFSPIFLESFDPY